MSMRRGLAIVVALAVLVIAPATAEAIKVKTNRGGVCNIRPITSVQGDQVTYGVNVPGCRTRNGVRRIASIGLAIDGRQIASQLRRKLGTAPYSNVKTGDRTAPDDSGGGLIPPILPDVPELPDVPDLPLPIPVPPLPDLPGLLPGGGGGSDGSRRTYTRLDYSIRLKRNKGKRANKRPERWRKKRQFCRRATTKYTNDTIVCRSFAPTN